MSSIGAFFRVSELIAPPDLPVRGYGDWKRFVSANGFWPPEDYRMLIREYGAGTFGGWLQLIEPFNPSWTFLDRVEVECRTVQSRQQKAPAAHPGWAVWPVAGGFLPWATTSTGDHVGWRTEGPPERWTTLLWCRDGQGSTEYAVGTVGFVLGLVERSLSIPCVEGNDRASFAPAPT